MSHCIADVWESYERNLLDPINAGFAQRQETRRAFYGGAGAVLTLQLRSLVLLSDKEAIKILKLWHAEVEEFKNKVLRGEA